MTDNPLHSGMYVMGDDSVPDTECAICELQTTIGRPPTSQEVYTRMGSKEREEKDVLRLGYDGELLDSTKEHYQVCHNNWYDRWVDSEMKRLEAILSVEYNIPPEYIFAFLTASCKGLDGTGECQCPPETESYMKWIGLYSDKMEDERDCQETCSTAP